MKKIVAIDMDDVLADSVTFWHAEINRRTGASIPLEAYKQPADFNGYYERVWQQHGIGESFTFADIDSHMVQDQSGIKGYAQSLEVLTLLAERYELCIVTARNNDQEAATKRWLESFYPGLFKVVRFASDPQRKMVISKGEICKELGASWLVDDNPDNCESALEYGVKAVLFGEYGWHHKKPYGMPHCKDWPAVLEYFNGQR